LAIGAPAQKKASGLTSTRFHAAMRSASANRSMTVVKPKYRKLRGSCVRAASARAGCACSCGGSIPVTLPRCTWLSIKPGTRNLPVPSMIRPAVTGRSTTSAIVSPRTTTVAPASGAERSGDTTVTFWITSVPGASDDSLAGAHDAPCNTAIARMAVSTHLGTV
jgi:hypothetical protein